LNLNNDVLNRSADGLDPDARDYGFKRAIDTAIEALGVLHLGGSGFRKTSKIFYTNLNFCYNLPNY